MIFLNLPQKHRGNKNITDCVLYKTEKEDVRLCSRLSRKQSSCYLQCPSIACPYDKGLSFRWLLSGTCANVKLEDFAASKGWLVSLAKCNALQIVTLSGESGSVKAASVAQHMISFCKRLEQYELSWIFNMNETGLFYNPLPRQTNIRKHENGQSARETKAMKAKDRIIGHVWTLAAIAKVPMCIIGKPTTPRFFYIKKPPVPYFSQRNAWSDTMILEAL